MINDFTLLEVATINADLTMSDYMEDRAYNVKKRVLQGEPLCVMAVKDSKIDIATFNEYCDIKVVENTWQIVLSCYNICIV